MDKTNTTNYHASVKKEKRRTKRMMMTAAQVAEKLGVSEKTVRAWVLKGSIPYTKVGKFVRFSEEQAESMVRVYTPAGWEG